MAKNTKKVKKNMVQSKVTKKKKTPAVKKKTRKAKVTMDNIYGILNRVQINRKKAVFAVTNEDVDVVENIVRDINLPYHLVHMKTQSVFTVEPGDEVDSYNTIDIEYLEDEICPEDEVDFNAF